MKKKLLLSLLFAAFAVSQLSAQMLVGSYNIRLKVSSDSVNGNVWGKRCQVMCDQLNFMSPDIFGTQEVLHVQLLDMLDRLDGYDYIGVGRDDGNTGGEYAAIFYKTDRLRLLDYGNFWLNETPDRPGLGWDAACIRICTWGKFASQTATDDEAFYFFNLHMDHVGVVARREAAKLIVSKVREIAQGAPVIVTGDFNVDQNDEIYSIFTQSALLKDSYLASRIRFAENGTFNSFDTDLYTDSRIDHIFVSPSINVDAYGILTNSYWTPDNDSSELMKGHDAPQEIDFSRYVRRQPSDHYPVFVRINFLNLN
ncbi:MAG: endonuclease/exonuclease/phosphatase family protein [Muribaculaceae bacterium]|nr:endonuclease/exonuclease/phosphatase family protein [Muribaculaceae bacterium]MBR0492933.1 endonuclease/exonuclease/phosphatase family protein [Muribaculaceae bacterium]